MQPTLYVILVLTCFTLNAEGQTRRIPKKVKGLNENCYYAAKFSASRRLTFYPFNKSDSVVLVSFRHQVNDFPIKGDAVIVDSLIETKHLSRKSVDQFTDILFNHFYIKPDNIGSITQCFVPRNAILFFENNVLKESILICFHCSGYEVSSGKYGVFGEECDQKLGMIRRFFISNGVSFGTDLEIERYPGETFKYDGEIAPPIK